MKLMHPFKRPKCDNNDNADGDMIPMHVDHALQATQKLRCPPIIHTMHQAVQAIWGTQASFGLNLAVMSNSDLEK